MDYIYDHPELQSGEMFLGNYNKDSFYRLSKWETKRLGMVAYDSTGKVISTIVDGILSDDSLYPVFVKHSDVGKYLVSLKRKTMRMSEYEDSLMREPTKENCLGFNSNHPELQEGEVFVGNMNQALFDNAKWETKRKGIVAYDFLGNDISNPDGNLESKLFPVFELKR